MISQSIASGVSSSGEGEQRASREYSSLVLEWQEARLSMDRFDKITVDLRKYGFTFIAIIMSSTSIIFDANRVQNPLPLVLVPIVIALLTFSLFLADSYYQVLLLAAILHARQLENYHKEILSRDAIDPLYLGFNITNHIEERVKRTNAHFYTVVVYILFLVISGLMGYVSLWGYELSLHIRSLAAYFWILTGGLAVIAVFMAVVSQGVSKLLREMRQTEMVDNRFVIQKLYEKKDVEKATRELTARIHRIYKDTPDFRMFPLGKGGLLFAERLIGALRKQPYGMTNIGLITAFTKREAEELTIEQPKPIDIQGKNVLIVDDLVSHGRTLLKAIELCRGLGAETVRTCVLIDAYKKRTPSAAGLHVDLVGIRTTESQRYFVGSGLDGGPSMNRESAEKFRLLPYIGVLVASHGNDED